VNVLPKLPESPDAWSQADWATIEAPYAKLAAAPLDQSTADAWLATWSRLEELLTEAASLAMIAYTTDTRDPAREATHLRFSTDIMPKATEASVTLARRLLDSGITRPGLETALKRFRASADIFRAENVAHQSALEGVSADYQRITGRMTANWDGEELPLPRLQPFLKSADRSVRERAFRAMAAPYVAEREPLAALFDQVLLHGRAIAENSGFSSYLEYIFPAKYRFDYTPDDCRQLHDAIEERVVPAVARAMKARAEQLGLDSLRPWDVQVDPWRPGDGRAFADGEELAARAGRAFQAVDPAFGEYFRIMQREALLDLDSRAGKAPGGYCDTLHFRGRPFIFMNSAGVREDVTTLLHEAGHAFHAFESHQQPLIWQRHPTSEAAELASMSMELLAEPYLASPAGFYDEGTARTAELEHLEDILLGLAHIASVDAFQSWLHTAPEARDPAERDRKWLEIRERFEPEVDWDGLTKERVARWYRQLHIFLYPFYYIEYAIAQLGALQVWRNARRDHPSAVRAYRKALTLGATASLPDLYRAAGARLTFDARGVGELVDLVEERMEDLRAGLVAAG
jgi:oligoendopeptidase F